MCVCVCVCTYHKDTTVTAAPPRRGRRTRQPFDLIYLYPVIPLVRTTDDYYYVRVRERIVCALDTGRARSAGPGFFSGSSIFPRGVVLLFFFIFIFPPKG